MFALPPANHIPLHLPCDRLVPACEAERSEYGEKQYSWQDVRQFSHQNNYAAIVFWISPEGCVAAPSRSRFRNALLIPHNHGIYFSSLVRRSSMPRISDWTIA